MNRSAMLLAFLLLLATGAACGPADPGDPNDWNDGGISDGGTDGGDGGSDGGDDGGTDGGMDGGDGGDGGPTVTLSIASVTPPRGDLAGGTLVVLTGSGFVDGFALRGGPEVNDQTDILFGPNASLEVNVIDDDTIEVRTPVGLTGDVDVTLRNPNGEFVCESCFAYFEPLQLTSISPSEGSALGGELVTLHGRNFSGVSLVLVGGVAATEVNVAADGASLTARTPPGVAGGADVGVVGRNSTAFLRRAFVYNAPVRVHELFPPVAPVAGGTQVSVFGSGFTAGAQVLFDDVAVPTTFVSATELSIQAPASAAGVVDVSVTDRGGTAVLEGGFLFVDPGDRRVTLHLVSPNQGSVSGGNCASGTGCVRLAGTGFANDGLEVRIGDREATVHRIDGNHLVEVDLPPGIAGLADVQVRTAGGGGTLEGAFGYVEPLVVAGISPSRVDANGSGSVRATVSGSGFDADCRVRVGADDATVASVSLSPSGDTFDVDVPPSSEGHRDVRVTCGDEGSPLFREAVLGGAFRYVAPLSLLQVEAPSGAMAGNTRVSVYGTGFEDGLSVTFDGSAAKNVEVVGPHEAQLRTPRGNVGFADVAATLANGSNALLRAGYGYTNPTNMMGGASGGPMLGTLNVTVLNGTPGMRGPVSGAKVAVNGNQLEGVTDNRGQVTFSDGILLKPVTITVSKEMFSTTTIARLDARNLSVFISLNDGDGDPSMNPSEPQPPADLLGRVCGFKMPPGIELTETQRIEARVRMAARYVYSAPPFGSLMRPAVIEEDCGAFHFRTSRFGTMALYAEFGIADDADQSFRPVLMGILRNVEAQPGQITEDLDILLNMHRDMTVPVSIEPADPPAGYGLQNRVYSYLDLGGEGVIPLSETVSRENHLVLTGHPRVSGDGVVFLNMAGAYDEVLEDVVPPYSYFYRRQLGDLRNGVELGPMLEFSRVTTPVVNGSFDGTVAWDLSGGAQAQIQQVVVQQPVLFASRLIWEVVLPGGERTVTLPPELVARLEPKSRYYLSLTTARSPRFDFNRFSYDHLGLTAWTAFTQNYIAFDTP